MTTNPVLGYSLPQKLIHWLMAALIFFNLLFTDGMEHWNRLVSRGEAVTPDDIASANVHTGVPDGLKKAELAICRSFAATSGSSATIWAMRATETS